MRLACLFKPTAICLSTILIAACSGDDVNSTPPGSSSGGKGNTGGSSSGSSGTLNPGGSSNAGGSLDQGGSLNPGGNSGNGGTAGNGMAGAGGMSGSSDASADGSLPTDSGSGSDSTTVDTATTDVSATDAAATDATAPDASSNDAASTSDVAVVDEAAADAGSDAPSTDSAGDSSSAMDASTADSTATDSSDGATQAPWKVEYKSLEGSHINFSVVVTNNAAAPTATSSLKIRYYFSDELSLTSASAAVFDTAGWNTGSNASPYYKDLTSSCTATLSADAGPKYFELSCNDALAVNPLDTVTIQFRLALEGENPVNDYSYAAGALYSVNQHIVLLQGATVVFGTPP
jgi:Cellulose binding domain